ncbi:MAG: hypothetical protein HY744_04190 [Deltaproteobacteria bacterium]|nr:hypothetical protein [Deltaproteobacteria bacterium]
MGVGRRDGGRRRLQRTARHRPHRVQRRGRVLRRRRGPRHDRQGGAGGGGAGGGAECAQKCPGLDTDCGHRICVEGKCGFAYEPAATACFDAPGQGYCDGAGKCVECLENDDCTGEAVCQQRRCVPGSCANDKLDGSETDLDCGGDCAGCANGKTCQEAGDCQSGFCAGGGEGGDPQSRCAACQGEPDCAAAPGTYCEGGVCAKKKLAGDVCGGAHECLSGSCPAQDGACCEAPCDSLCQACRMDKTGQPNGVCAPVEAGEDPDKECPKQVPCGASGTGCNGDAKAPGCKLFVQGTECEEPTCAQGEQTSAALCDGKGQCVPGEQSACAPYLCNAQATACLTACTQGDDCLAGHYCDGGGKCQPHKAKGNACAADKECATGHCADGRCCDQACLQICWACNLAQLEGACALVPFGQNPGGKECPADRGCNGAGTCLTLDGKACKLAGECLSGSCPDKDGLCCDSACAGACQACRTDKTGAPNGTCAPVKAGQDPDKECPDLGPAQCGPNGTGCNGQPGSPGCKLYADATVCKTASCAAGVQTMAAKCNGQGQCVPGQQSACEPYACNQGGTACLLACAGDGACAAGHYCAAGACEKKKISGKSCGESKQCLSGLCVDGFCCDGLCVGACNRCDEGGKQGVCSLLGKGAAGSPSCSPYLCDGVDAACPTTCAGDGDCAGVYYCDQAKHCAPKQSNAVVCLAPNQCLSGWCADGYCCDGSCGGPCDGCDLGGNKGSCKLRPKGAPGSPDCAPYLCDGLSPACPKGCAGDGDCAAQHYCSVAKTCLPLKALGEGCGEAKECLSGLCIDAVCCDKACGGACDGCDLGGSKGSCKPRAKGAAGSPSCAPYLCDGQSAGCPTSCAGDGDCAGGYYCDLAGQCAPQKGNGATCQSPAQCASGFCADGYCCDKACGGACEACDLGGSKGTCTPLAKGTAGSPDCSPYVCDGLGGPCPSSCAGDDDCAAQHYCSVGKSCLPLKVLGQGCNEAKECLSGLCVDAVCCESSCAGACDACDLGGDKGSLGSPCAQPPDCASGYCIDGVCCDKPCAGACEACLALWTKGQDGTCAFIPDLDPQNECVGMWLCDGKGGCEACGNRPTPPGGGCPGQCSGGCIDGGKTCSIDCFANPGACQGKTLSCPAGFACQVLCQGPQPFCSGTVINCPDHYGCDVLCQGQVGICSGATINCSPSGPCSLSCGSPEGCGGTTIKCGNDACDVSCTFDGKIPTQQCGQACGCSNDCMPP